VAVATAAIKERNSMWTLGLTIVEIHRSVKACRERGVSLNQRRKRPTLADIDHFLRSLERVYSNSEYIVTLMLPSDRSELCTFGWGVLGRGSIVGPGISLGDITKE